MHGVPTAAGSVVYLASRREWAGQFDVAELEIARGLAVVARQSDRPATRVLRGNFLFRRGDLELCRGRYPEAVKTLAEGVREQAVARSGMTTSLSTTPACRSGFARHARPGHRHCG